MEALRTELRRLGRAYARAVGGRRAARVHGLALVAALAAACVHRLLLPLPGMARLEGHWGPTLLVAALLLALGPLLARLVALAARPRARALARSLDDRFAWRDETSTALGLPASAAGRPVPALLLAQAAGRLREIPARTFATSVERRGWPRVLVVLLFAFLLLAPGVSGFLGRAGRERSAAGGEAEDREPLGPPRPMRADFWLQQFVENPIPVEPLPEASTASAARGAR